MKRIIVLIIVCFIVCTMIFSLAGCTDKAVVDSKKVIKGYYNSLNSGDMENIILLLDDTLLAGFGDKDSFSGLLLSRVGLLGDKIAHEVVETTYDKTGDMVVIVEAKAQYSNNPHEYQEIFELKNIDNKMMITNIYLERQKAVENALNALFSSYNSNDKECLTNLFANAFYDVATKSDVVELAHDMKNVLGEYKYYNIIEEDFFSKEYSKQGVVLLYDGNIDVAFEKGNAKVYIKLCMENGNVKILDISVIPDIIQSAIDKYFKLMKDSKYDSILDMYLDVFYENTDGGRKGWRDELRFLNEYGSYNSHEIVNWDYVETKLDDTSILKTVAVGVNAQFGDNKQYNVFKILLNPHDNSIIYHTIEIEDK